MGCASSHIADSAEEAARRREEIIAQARRQKIRESQSKQKDAWIRHQSQKRIDKTHKAEGVPEGWGIPPLGYAKMVDGPCRQFPWST